MADFIQNTFGITSPAAIAVITIALMLFCGFAMTRLTKLLKLPNVTAYIITGIFLGPFCLDAVPQTIIDGTEFLSDVALAFIAFSTGEFFKLNVLKKNGAKVVLITLTEAFLASAAVFGVLYGILRVDLAFSIVLSALAAATASASTMMTIRQTGAKGDFVNTLLQVVALDNVISLIAYSVSISVAVALIGGEKNATAGDVFFPLLINMGVFLLGGVFGFFLTALLKKRSTDNRLIVSIAVLFAFCGVCAVLDVSPLLGCMSMATVYVNVSGDEKLFKQLNYFSPPLLLLFFVRSGVSFDLGALFDFSASVGSVSLLVIGIAYFTVRIVGKYAGAYLGSMLAGKDKKVRNNLGLALIPQAGVSIGLAALGARAIGGEVGQALHTVILASGVLYELVGPAAAKLSLHLAGSYSEKIEDIVLVETVTEDGKTKTEAQLLVERIQKIQKELPEKGDTPTEDEQAFLEAAEEQYAAMLASRRRPFSRNR
ncbi:MAG: cation:proton antiporter [Clostridia bacterium]|nr:cation:proton antiporter [Clostridia bacterium]